MKFNATLCFISYPHTMTHSVFKHSFFHYTWTIACCQQHHCLRLKICRKPRKRARPNIKALQIVTNIIRNRWNLECWSIVILWSENKITIRQPGEENFIPPRYHGHMWFCNQRLKAYLLDMLHGKESRETLRWTSEWQLQQAWKCLLQYDLVVLYIQNHATGFFPLCKGYHSLLLSHMPHCQSENEQDQSLLVPVVKNSGWELTSIMKFKATDKTGTNALASSLQQETEIWVWFLTAYFSNIWKHGHSISHTCCHHESFGCPNTRVIEFEPPSNQSSAICRLCSHFPVPAM